MLLNTILYEIVTEKIENVQWVTDVKDHIYDLRFPLTPRIVNTLDFGRVTAFHITSARMAMQLASIQGKSKAVSAFTKMALDRFDELRGVWHGGVLYKIEGTMQASRNHDMDSAPDKRGRRWIDFMKMGREGQILWKAWVHFYDANGRGDHSSYFDIAYNFALKYKDELSNVLYQHNSNEFMFNDLIGSWNELLLSDIKILGVIIVKNPSSISNRYSRYLTGPLALRDELPKSLVDKIINTAPPGTAHVVTYPFDHKDKMLITKFLDINGGL